MPNTTTKPVNPIFHAANKARAQSWLEWLYASHPVSGAEQEVTLTAVLDLACLDIQANLSAHLANCVEATKRPTKTNGTYLEGFDAGIEHARLLLASLSALTFDKLLSDKNAD